MFKLKSTGWLLLLFGFLFSLTIPYGADAATAAHVSITPQEPASDEKCGFCQMKVYPKDHELGKFAAQLVTADGKRVFFDDIGCMLNYKRSLPAEPQKMWVRDYHSLDWIEYGQAHIISADMKTPMQYGFAFFKSESDTHSFIGSNKSLNPTVVDRPFVDKISYENMKMKSQKHGNMMHNMHSSQPKTIKVSFNGKELTFSQQPVMMNNRVLVPLREFFEALGATVKWNGATKSITTQKSGISVYLQIGSKQAKVNNKQVGLDVPAQLIHSKMMVPIRFISEAMGAKVGYKQETKTVMIKSN